MEKIDYKKWIACAHGSERKEEQKRKGEVRGEGGERLYIGGDGGRWRRMISMSARETNS